MERPSSTAAEVQRRRLQQVEARARQLMEELGRQELGEALQERGWTFGFDRAKRRLGLCTWKKGGTLVRRISVSRYYAALNGLGRCDERGLDVLDDVIRHEIAHAIDYERHGTSSHGRRWKAICRRVGADPSRVYEGRGIARVPGRYVATCPGCGKEVDYHRRPKRERACAGCCRRYNGGRYSERFKLALIDRETGRQVAYRGEVGRRGTASQQRGYKYTGRCRGCGFETGYRRKLKRIHACPRCCARHAGGRFDAAYALTIVQNY